MAVITHFNGGDVGTWQVERIHAVTGPGLEMVKRLSIVTEDAPVQVSPVWRLRGVVSNERYVHRAEKNELVARQPDLGRGEATLAAIIPLRKSAAWWALTQDERRAIFEERSHHIVTGLKYLPAVARRLYHSRDLNEPFDFVTYFEYAPANAAQFDSLLGDLRRSEEWTYVEREVDIRMSKV